jgi:hypothetical protein
MLKEVLSLCGSAEKRPTALPIAAPPHVSEASFVFEELLGMIG